MTPSHVCLPIYFSWAMLALIKANRVWPSPCYHFSCRQQSYLPQQRGYGTRSGREVPYGLVFTCIYELHPLHFSNLRIKKTYHGLYGTDAFVVVFVKFLLLERFAALLPAPLSSCSAWLPRLLCIENCSCQLCLSQMELQEGPATFSGHQGERWQQARVFFFPLPNTVLTKAAAKPRFP